MVYSVESIEDDISGVAEAHITPHGAQYTTTMTEEGVLITVYHEQPQVSSYPRPDGHFCTSPTDDEMCWEVTGLWEAAKDIIPEAVSLANLPECNDPHMWIYHWRDLDHPWVSPELPRIEAADLSYPILFHPAGWLMDGMHRVAKTLMSGRTVGMAVRFTPDTLPPPWDYC